MLYFGRMHLITKYIGLFAILFFANLPSFSQEGFVFIENKGQWPEQVLAATDLPNGRFYIERQGLTIDLYKLEEVKHNHQSNSPHQHAKRTQRHVYKQKWINSSATPTISGAQKLPTKYNFFLGNDETKWASACNGYLNLTVENIYPNIDLVFYSSGEEIKYDFIVGENADPSLIQWKYEGIENLKVDRKQILLHTSIGDIKEKTPVSYILNEDQEKNIIDIYYKRIANNIYGFDIPKEGASKKLQIDPTLTFSSLSGSQTDNFGYTASFDYKGFLYSGSSAFGNSYPTTVGAYDTQFNGGTVDIAISKFDTTGSFMVYSTYIGGNGDELPHSLIVDENEHLFVLGSTSSSNYPVTANAIQTTFMGGPSGQVFGLGVAYAAGADMIISKFSQDGSSLSASTFLGGTDADGFNHNLGGSTTENPLIYNYADEVRGEIEFDNQGNIYVVSTTRSTDFPVTANTFQSVHGGKTDGVIVKVDNNLETIIWATFYGGSGYDAAQSIQVNSRNEVIFSGGTTSPNLPMPPSPVQGTFGGGRADGYIGRLTENGETLLSATYSGTNTYDQIYFVDLDLNDDIFILGQTQHTGSFFHTGNRGFQEQGGGQYIAKYNTELTSQLWSTTFGTNGTGPNISPTAFLTDACSRIFVSGWGSPNVSGSGLLGTNGMTTTSDAYQKTTDGNDFYLLITDIDAQSLLYATYMGGASADEHVDGGTSRFDKRGIVYQAVCANCRGVNSKNQGGFPTTTGAHSETNNSPNCNLAVFKFDPDLNTVIADFDAEDPVCLPDPVQFTNYSHFGEVFTWYFGDGTTSSDINPAHEYTEAGVYDVTLVIENPNGCNVTDTMTKQVLVLSPENITLRDTSICNGTEVQIGFKPLGNPDISYQWSPTTGLSNPNISNPIAEPTITTTYTLQLNFAGACTSTASQTVNVVNVEMEVPKDTLFCDTTDIPYRLNANGFGTIDEYSWSENSSFNPLINANKSTSFVDVSPQEKTTYYIKGHTYQCSLIDSVVVDIVPNINIPNYDNEICEGDSVTIGFTSNRMDELTFSWSPTIFMDNPNSNQPEVKPNTKTTYNLSVDYKTCNYDVAFPIDVTILELEVPNDTLLCGLIPTTDIHPNGFGTIDDFHWSTNIDFSDHLNSDSSLQIPIDTTQYFYIKGTTKGCEIIDSIRVETFPFFEITSNDTAICDVDSIQMGVTQIANNQVQYSWSPATNVSETDVAMPKFYPDVTTTYYLTISYQHCDTTIPFTIHVNIIDLTIPEDTLVCGTNPFLYIKADGKGSIDKFEWGENLQFNPKLNTGPLDSAISVFPTEPTYYYIRATKELCTTVDSILVEIFPTVTYDPREVSYCEKDSLEIGIEPLEEDGVTYSWSPVSFLTNTNTPKTIAYPGDKSTYTLTVSYQHCDSSFNFTIDPIEIDLDISNDTLLCDTRSTIDLFADGKNTVDEYYWSDTRTFDSFINSSPIDKDISVAPDTTTYYYIRVVKAGCVVEDSVRVETFPEITFINQNSGVCTGDTINIGVTDLPVQNATYSWDPNIFLSDDDLPNVLCFPDSPIDYNLTINYQHCDTILPFSVSSDDVNYEISNDTLICGPIVSDSLWVNGFGSVNQFEWSSDKDFATLLNDHDKDSTININTDTTQYYYIRLSTNGCVQIDSVLVETFPATKPFSQDTTICFGDSIQIGVNNLPQTGVTYQWSPATDISNISIPFPTVYPSDTITYSLLMEYQHCDSVQEFPVNVVNLKLQMPNDTLVCGGNPSINLKANGFGTIDNNFWSDAQGNMLNATQQDDSFIANPTQNTTYYYSGTTYLCSITDSVNVRVFPLTTPILTDATICLGDTILIGIEEKRNDVTYSWSPNFFIDSLNTSTTTVRPVHSVTYNLTIAYEHCDSIVPIDIEVIDIQVELPNDTIVCSPPDFAAFLPLIANGNGTIVEYYWASDPNFNNLLNNNTSDPQIDVPYTNATYYFRGVNGSCEIIDSVQIEIFPELKPILQDTAICIGESLEIGVEPFTNTKVQYSWSPSTWLDDPTLLNPNATPLDTIVYTLYLSMAHCNKAVSHKVDVIDINLLAQNDTLVCDGSIPIQLDANGFGTIEEWYWYDYPTLNNPINSDPFESSVIILPSISQYYFVKGVSYRCEKVDSVLVQVFSDVISTTPTITYCLDDTVTASVKNNSNYSPVFYTWGPPSLFIGGNTGEKVTFLPSQDTTIWVTAQLPKFGCTDSDSIRISLSDLYHDSLSITLLDTLLYKGKEIDVKGYYDGPYPYEWLPSEEFDNIPPSLFQTIELQDSLWIYLVAHSGTCSLADSIYLNPANVICGPPNIFVPNAFTPNLDGNNDELLVRGKYIEEMTFQVFDRWGELVFETQDQMVGWDGIYKDHPLNPAVFVYQLNVLCVNKRQYNTQGNVTLIR